MHFCGWHWRCKRVTVNFKNTGIKETKGEWIAFLDGDDEWNKDYLNIIRELHKSYPICKILATACEMMDVRRVINFIIINRISFDKGHSVSENYFEVALNSHPPLR
jgi:glycosyltransferase involved in cell wall biosynthesis